MAGRFLFQKLSSWMSRSSEPVTRLASVWEGSIRIHNHAPAAHHTTVAPNNSGIHGYECGIRTLHNLFNGASAHPSMAAPKLPATHGHATRYFNTMVCTRASSETGIPTRSSPPVLALKPELVNSAGVRRTFSSSTSTNDTITRTAELDAKLAASKAEVADWFAQKRAETYLQEMLEASGYKAPELTKMRDATKESDIYSLGVILLEMLAQKEHADDDGRPNPREGARRLLSDGKGRVLSEEERAKESIYIQKMERERQEKLKKKLEQEKADADKTKPADSDKKTEGSN
ncbi:uncharacterized protein C2845_PMPSC055707 [Panicum miliaceum]|uniref:Protein kinase domain-containing protein n=1 Tax=Panicum miliaceum TaxID=4540 RepID=A0A3L6P9I5_PANMI|nr:uncharacterized protein C2845_PMPSC055707 [Panicum miliaceum]